MGLISNGTTILDNGSLSSGIGGKVLQVVQTAWDDTLQVTVSQSYSQIAALNTNITCSSTSSKVLIEGTVYVSPAAATNPFPAIRLTKGGSVISDAIGNSSGSRKTVTGATGRAAGDDTNNITVISFSYLDSPSSTSQLTYGMQLIAYGNRTVNVNFTGTSGEVGAATISTITLTEIA